VLIADPIGSEVALMSSILDALILEDTFVQTATQITTLLTSQKRKGAKPEHEAVLKLLAVFTEGIT
jgi:hypothetical protein